MELSSRVLWDVDDKDNLNYEENFQWIICRVLSNGTMQDWHNVKNYYGTEKIIEAAKSAKYLPKKSLHFVSNVYEVPLTEFRCYYEAQCNKESWYNSFESFLES